MAYYPQSATGLNAISYPSGNAQTTVTASGSTNTKGSYTDIAASAAFACCSTREIESLTNVRVASM